ncbi:MAG: hypothetical protein KAW94_03515, partial [Candidatus Thorarchaeota archaeon]|nr:hypothetical protein [Candidatus Thorarchaeota archaeon]
SLPGDAPMSDPNERIRDQMMTIHSLNQKIDVLQAQLGGAQKRAHQLEEQLAQLEQVITQKDAEIQALGSDVQRYSGALDSMGREVQNLRAEQTPQHAMAIPMGNDQKLGEQLAAAQQVIQKQKGNLMALSRVATAVLNSEDNALENLQRVLLEAGDQRFRVLNLVLTKRSVRIEEVASILVVDVSKAREIADTLQAAGEVEIGDGNTIIPAKKYREVKVPVEEWRNMDPLAIFDSLDGIIGKTEGGEGIVIAIEAAVDILEQKISRGGTLVFEMRRTANSWKKEEGNVQELQYKIREWKARAQSLG